MKEIKYIKGDATRPRMKAGEVAVICHCCNVFGGWGRGFVLALRNRYPQAESDYRSFCAPYQSSNARRNDLMGQLCLSKVRNEIYVANIIGQYFYSMNQKDIKNTAGVADQYMPVSGRFVNYDAIRAGFRKIYEGMSSEGKRFSIHMPRMGCGLAGGDWGVIEKIIAEEFSAKGIEVMVYDL